MAGFTHDVSRYLEFHKGEWQSLLVTAGAIGFILSFRHWGGEEFNLVVGLGNLLFSFVAAAIALAFQLLIQKLVGIRFGLAVTYDKYIIGLLLGVFVAFFTFGYLPLFTTGTLQFRAIDNLRVGRFRAVIPKNYELALVAAGGVLGPLLLTIPLKILHTATGLQPVWHFTVIMFLVAAYSLLPIPVIKTTNPYAVYMSRMEALEGNTPGYDIMVTSFILYFFSVGLVVAYGFLVLLFEVTVWTLLIALLAGLLAMWIFSRVKLLYDAPRP